MKKYDKELINNYINKENIDKYLIKALKNNKEFMKLVIEKTNNKNYYNLVSDNIKKDYDFVKFIINKFKDDIEFICIVADYYLEDSLDDFNKTELIIIMSKLTYNKNNKKYLEYKLLKDTLFMAKRMQIEVSKLELKDKYVSEKIGMGFLVIFDSYNNSKIILDFYAKRLVESIFEDYNINLEAMLHQQFNNPLQINKSGIKNYIINFIQNYDTMLAFYLSVNTNLMEDLENEIINIQNNWNKFEVVNEKNKYNLIFDKVHEYMNQTEEEGILNETDLLYYAGKELGIIEKILKYAHIDLDTANEIENGLDNELLKDTFSISFVDKLHYNNIKKIIIAIVFGNYHDDSNDYSDNNKGKILKLKNKS